MKLVAVGVVLGLLAVARAQPLPEGAAVRTVDVGLPLEVFTYKPAGYAGGPLIVVFHGVGRNADEYRDWAIPLARRFGAIVAAPKFDQDRFPSEAYQRGGITRQGVPQAPEQWTYALVPRLVDALRGAEGRRELDYYFIGHSAGGQFLVRLAALAGSLGARRVVAANPGSHLFPDLAAPYGYGLGGLSPELANAETLRRYLAAPLTLYLGTGDIDPEDDSLDRSAEALRQGPHRYARGLACWAAVRKLAQDRGWALAWRKVETPGIGHSAEKMFAAPEVAEALFGPQG